MRKTALIWLALGFSFVSVLHAAKGPELLDACSTGCIAEKNHCVAKLGPAATANCGDGMQLCVERCNPRRQNSAALSAASEQERYARSTAIDTEANQEVQLCTQKCEVASTQCPRSGLVVTNECGLGRQACIDRCFGN